MPENAFVQPQPSALIDKRAIVASTPGVASAAKWFWWIAGLSVVNTVLINSGSDVSFVVGLGFMQLADVVFQSIKAVAFVIDAVAAGFFVLMGVLALRGHLWAFFLGALVYLGDALIYLYVGDMMSVGFHGLALFFIVKGAFTLRTALKDAVAAQVENAAAPAGTSLPPELPKA